MVDTSAHTVNLCTMARGRPCHSLRLTQGRLCHFYGSESLGFLTWLCSCHECSYILGYTRLPQFLLGNWFCLEADPNSRLSERKAKQVFTINHIVCTKSLADWHQEHNLITQGTCQNPFSQMPANISVATGLLKSCTLGLARLTLSCTDCTCKYTLGDKHLRWEIKDHFSIIKKNKRLSYEMLHDLPFRFLLNTSLNFSKQSAIMNITFL